MDTSSKPTLVLLGHPLLFDNTFLCLSMCFTCLFSPVWHLFLTCLYYAFPSICLFACLMACLFCLCMYTHGARTLGARVRPLRRRQKGQGCKQEDASPQSAMFSRLGGLDPLERSSLSLSLSLFSRACIRVPPLFVPIYFSCSLLGPRSLGMSMFVLYFLYLAGPYPWNVSNV